MVHVDVKARKAFEILVRENSRMLTAYLRSLMLDDAAVDDLFQETMIVAWRRLDECDLDRPFGPWLRGIASRLALAHYRRQRREPTLLSDQVLAVIDRQFESIQTQSGDTWDDKLRALRGCLDTLPDNQRDAVKARYLDNLPTQEVADRFQISLEACKKRLQRGRAMLAQCLRRKGVFLATENAP